MYTRILVPLDGSPTAERGLREALALAASQKATLYLLHVVADFALLLEMSDAYNYEDMRKSLRQYGLEVLAKARAAAQTEAVHTETLMREVTGDRIGEVIVNQAQQHQCDLIVMGTHGRRGFSRVTLGSEADWVIRHSPVPVLLVRQPDVAHAV